MKKRHVGSDGGPVVVYRGTEEAFYAPMVASMNAEGIEARAMDTAQTGLRWDIQIISPVEVWVPGPQEEEARAFVAAWEGAYRARRREAETARESADEAEPATTRRRGAGLWRALCWGILFAIVLMHFWLIPFALFGIVVVEGTLWWRRCAGSEPNG